LFRSEPLSCALDLAMDWLARKRAHYSPCGAAFEPPSPPSTSFFFSCAFFPLDPHPNKNKPHHTARGGKGMGRETKIQFKTEKVYPFFWGSLVVAHKRRTSDAVSGVSGNMSQSTQACRALSSPKLCANSERPWNQTSWVLSRTPHGRTKQVLDGYAGLVFPPPGERAGRKRGGWPHSETSSDVFRFSRPSYSSRGLGRLLPSPPSARPPRLIHYT
jgi:hypothetical protein